MQPPPASPLVVTQSGNVTVVRLGHPIILRGDAAEAVGDHLQRLLDDGRVNVLFDFANVQSVTSLIIGKLVLFNKKLGAAGGRLALCEVSPDVRGVFDVVRLPQLVSVYDTEKAALDSFGG
jgi:anti-sigma B factor antagonist